LLSSLLSLAGTSVLIGQRTSHEAATSELLFGALLPLTGAWASSGIASQAALEIAVADINQYLSSQGSSTRIRVIVQNTQTDPDIALQKLRELSRQGIRMVIGPQSSAEVRVVKDFADSNRIVLISQSSTAGSLAIPGDNIFRFTQDDSYEGPAVAHLMREDGILAVIPMWRADDGNDGLQTATRNSFQSLGGSVAAGVRYATTIQEFTAELQVLRPQVSSAIRQGSC
jgi:branched-chain amino acid transport system substrate-binding protein